MTLRKKRPNFADCSIKTEKLLWELCNSYTIDNPAGIKLLALLGQLIDRIDQTRKAVKKYGLLVPDEGFPTYTNYTI